MSAVPRQDFGELSRAAQGMAWHRLTIAPEQVTLDGEMTPLAEPLRAEDFAADWFTLWLAANPDPHLPDEAIGKAQETVSREWLRDFGECLFARAFPGDAADRLRGNDAPIALSFDEASPDRLAALTADPEARVPVTVGVFVFETAVPRLADLPWELLCDGGVFLARTRGVVRVTPSPVPPPPWGEGWGGGSPAHGPGFFTPPAPSAPTSRSCLGIRRRQRSASAGRKRDRRPQVAKRTSPQGKGTARAFPWAGRLSSGCAP
jgi:hypothetical protein